MVKRLGARDAMILSMVIYCLYIGCFLLATIFPEYKYVSAITGASIGGVGAGFLWTAQVRNMTMFFEEDLESHYLVLFTYVLYHLFCLMGCSQRDHISQNRPKNMRQPTKLQPLVQHLF